MHGAPRTGGLGHRPVAVIARRGIAASGGAGGAVSRPSEPFDGDVLGDTGPISHQPIRAVVVW